MNMTSERIPHLRDLILLWVRTRYPYWVFRYGLYQSSVLLTEDGYAIAFIEDDKVTLLLDSWNVKATIPAADPDLFEYLGKHIIDIKRENSPPTHLRP